MLKLTSVIWSFQLIIEQIHIKIIFTKLFINKEKRQIIAL